MSAIEDFGVDANAMTPTGVVEYLDRRIGDKVLDIQSSQLWEELMGEHSQAVSMAELLKEIYLEIVMYQPDTVKGALAAIAELPRTVPAVLFEEMLHHQAEEFDHGEMALRDYVALGGDEEYARNRRPSPTAYAVSAIWATIGAKRDPFAYLVASVNVV
jgi:hypothetical protein